MAEVLKGWNGGERGGKSQWGCLRYSGAHGWGGCCGDLDLYLSDTGEEGTVLSRDMMGSVLCCGCLIFIYFLFLAAWGLPCHAQVSLGAARGGLLFAVGPGVSAQEPLIAEPMLWTRGLSSCGARGFLAPRQVGSSRTRGRRRAPCAGRWIPIHCASGEVLSCVLIKPCWLLSSDETAWRTQEPKPRALRGRCELPPARDRRAAWTRTEDGEVGRDGQSGYSCRERAQDLYSTCVSIRRAILKELQRTRSIK